MNLHKSKPTMGGHWYIFCLHSLFYLLILGNNIKWNGTAYVSIEDKSRQWFGATVQSSGVNGVIVVSGRSHGVIVSVGNHFLQEKPLYYCFV